MQFVGSSEGAANWPGRGRQDPTFRHCREHISSAVMSLAEKAAFLAVECMTCVEPFSTHTGRGYTSINSHVNTVSYDYVLCGVRIYRPVSWVIFGLLYWSYRIFLLLLGVWKGYGIGKVSNVSSRCRVSAHW